MNNDESTNNGVHRANYYEDETTKRSGRIGNKSGERKVRRMDTKQTQTRYPALTMTLYCPVRLGGSHSSWLSDTVTEQGVSPISTV